MSKKIKRCPKCGEKTEICAFSNNPDILMCCACNFKGNRGAFEAFIPTVFDHITQSPEVLAEKLVYQRNSKVIHQNDKCTVEYWTFSWKSSVIKGQSFETREGAIAATMKKLKEVEK